MSIQRTILVPELQFYLESMINASKLNFSQVYAPASAYAVDPNSRSFIRLLFDENWPIEFSFYKPLYRNASITECPSMMLSRLMLYPTTGRFYVADDSTDCTVNLFDLQNDDFHLLAALLEYRTQGTHFQFDTYNFEDLTTSLSKLIYIYLDLKVNDAVTYYDNDIIYSDSDDVLGNCYELYIEELVFNHFSDLGS